MDFKRDFICSAHWTNGTRMDMTQTCYAVTVILKRKLQRKQHQIELAKRALTKQPNEKVKRKRLL